MDNASNSIEHRTIKQTIAIFWLLLSNHYKLSGFPGVMKLLYALAIRPHSIGGNFFSSFGKKAYECPCCGWTGVRFLPHISISYCSFDHVCPDCLAHARHRSHHLLYSDYMSFEQRRGLLLYVSPEQASFPFFQGCSKIKVETSNYQAAPTDYYFGNTTYELDLMEISLENERFDYIICHHVVEHVPNDRIAMGELFRILKTGGLLILSVPISNQEKTIEYGEANLMMDNHFYRYGQDFVFRIPKGFKVTPWNVHDYVNASLMKKYGLQSDTDTVFLCERSA